MLGWRSGQCKVKWLCFPSSRITEQNLIMICWKAAMEIHSHSHSSIPIPILLLALPFSFPWYSHYHSHSHGNPVGTMESQLFPFPCTSLMPMTHVPEIGAENRYQFAYQTLRKPVLVFWYRFSSPIYGTCIIGIIFISGSDQWGRALTNVTYKDQRQST